MSSRVFFILLYVLNVRGSKIILPDGATYEAESWNAAWYDGPVPSGTHNLVFLSDVTVPYDATTCDPSTYTQSISGKVLVDTDGHGGESPLFKTCFNKKGGKPQTVATTLQKFKDSGVVAVISANWWLPHQYYVADVDPVFAANPGPARAVGMPWYVAQYAWNDGGGKVPKVRVGWREVFGGSYGQMDTCKPSCTSIPYPGRAGGTCITHSSPWYTSCTNVPTVKIELEITYIPILGWAFAPAMFAMYIISAIISMITIVMALRVIQVAVKNKAVDALLVALLEGIAGGVIRTWRSFNQPIGLSKLGPENVSNQSMRNIDAPFSLAASYIVCFSCFRLIRRTPLTPSKLKLGYAFVFTLSTAIFITLIVWTILIINDTTSTEIQQFQTKGWQAMITASFTMASVPFFFGFALLTFYKILSAARQTGKKDLMKTGVKVFTVSMISVIANGIIFLTYYSYACSINVVDFDCYLTGAPESIQYADYWVLELPPAIAGLAQVALYFSTSSSSSSSS